MRPCGARQENPWQPVMPKACKQTGLHSLSGTATLSALFRFCLPASGGTPVVPGRNRLALQLALELRSNLPVWRQVHIDRLSN
jgi:hypothetical protein